MTMGRLKIRNIFLHFREMQIHFLWDSKKRMDLKKRIANYAPSSSLFYTSLSPAYYGTKHYHFSLVAFMFYAYYFLE